MRRNLTPLTGLGFIAVVIAASVIAGDPPDADEGTQELIRHYSDNKNSIIMGALLSAIGLVALLFFANHLRAVLRRAEPPGTELSPLVLTGAIVLSAGVGFDNALSWAMAESAEDIDPVALQGMQAIWDNDFLPMAVGLAVMMIAAGLSIIRYRGLPVWLGWIAVVLGIAAITPAGFFAFLGGAVWILIVVVMLLMRRDDARPAATSPATPTV